MAPFQTTRRIEFRDTDAAGIVHFSVFFAFMESAEHELLRHVGLSVVSNAEGRVVSWPRVAARCDYREAIRFEDQVAIDVRVERLGNKSITYAFRFHCDGATIAEGSMTSVCCELPRGRDGEWIKPVPIEIPPDFRRKLQPYSG